MPEKDQFELRDPITNDDVTHYDIIYDCDIYYLHIWVVRYALLDEPPKWGFTLRKIIDEEGNVIKYLPYGKKYEAQPELIKFPKNYWLWKKQIYNTNIPRGYIENNKELFGQ